MDKILIFGHKKPDTDSVVSAITLSYLKNQLGLHTEPRILGEINNETKFVLDYFNTPVPKYLNDVKLQVKDVNYSKNYMMNMHSSINNCFEYMTQNKISILPIINNARDYLGAISTKDIARDLINNDSEDLCTSYTNIIETLNAKEIVKFNEEIEGNILIASYKSTTFIENVDLDENTILIVGDRHSIIEYACNQKVKLIILTGNCEIKDEHLEIAKENKVNIIKTPYNTFNVAKRIRLCSYIYKINFDKKVTVAHENDDLHDFIELANRTKFSNYPVLNKQNKCLGIISLAEAADKNLKKVILVDHNEQEQSVDDLNEAEIIEIIDHHKIGVLGTTLPINFRNMPVGSTNTIIFQLYKENNVEIPSNIAGLMLAGIISDTLLFKSPTTTDLDRQAVEHLSKIANIDYKAFAISMFKAGSMITNKSPEEILYSDFKNFAIDDKRIGIGQISTVNPNDILNNQSIYIELLNKIKKDHNYYIIALFITDIINACSYCLYSSDAEEVLGECFDKSFCQGVCLPNILSRKKQIIPAIMATLEKK